MNSIVAIVGRPNVGKSTLFNRLVQRREAIVDSVSGVTRDRHYGKSDWNGKEFSVIDTGGYIVGSDDIFEGEIRKQVNLAIEEADIIIFVVDVEEGITPMDSEVAKLLRKVKKPIFLAVNKVDNAMRDADAVEFYNLGLGGYHTISSINGSGTGDILDAITEKMPETEEIDLEKEELPRFAVVGRPNAGKSSFINSLIGEDRNIVTNLAGTTRDSIDTKYNRFGFDFNLVDTAGIRKKSKVKKDEHFWSPQLHLEIIEKTEKTSFLKGLFGPKPQVWTLFMFIHFVIGIAFLGFAIMLYSKVSLKEPFILPLIMIIFLPLFWVLFYFLGKVGRETGKNQMKNLHDFMIKVINN